MLEWRLTEDLHQPIMCKWENQKCICKTFKSIIYQGTSSENTTLIEKIQTEILFPTLLAICSGIQYLEFKLIKTRVERYSPMSYTHFSNTFCGIFYTLLALIFAHSRYKSTAAKQITLHSQKQLFLVLH